MSLYFWLNILIVAFPVVLSFDRKVAFWKQWPHALLAESLVGSVFVLWDVLVTQEGHWSFDARLAGSIRWLGLPLGEYIFFLTVPFACIFILAVVRGRTLPRDIRLPVVPFVVLGCLSFFTALVLHRRGYTFLVLIAFSVTLFLLPSIGRATMNKASTWLALLLSFPPFLIVNGLFTGIPIVSYSGNMIIGIRFGSIPIEDFFYNFSLISLSYIAFDHIQHWRQGGVRSASI